MGFFSFLWRPLPGKRDILLLENIGKGNFCIIRHLCICRVVISLSDIWCGRQIGLFFKQTQKIKPSNSAYFESTPPTTPFAQTTCLPWFTRWAGNAVLSISNNTCKQQMMHTERRGPLMSPFMSRYTSWKTDRIQPRCIVLNFLTQKTTWLTCDCMEMMIYCVQS